MHPEVGPLQTIRRRTVVLGDGSVYRCEPRLAVDDTLGLALRQGETELDHRDVDPQLVQQRMDIAVVLVEQYLDFARELGDFFAVMDRGAIVYSCTRESMDETALKRAMAI